MSASRTIALLCYVVVALLHTSSILLIVLGREMVQCGCSWRYGSSVVVVVVVVFVVCERRNCSSVGVFFSSPGRRRDGFSLNS
jgi:hypothetical protein